MARRTELWLLALILLIALALRVYDLRRVPPGAQHDEVFAANFATQIIDGARPVFWDQNGGVPAFHAYLVAPLFVLFGSSIVTLRLVSVACGLLVIVFTYLAARRLFDPAVALVSAALLGGCCARQNRMSGTPSPACMRCMGRLYPMSRSWPPKMSARGAAGE